MTIISFISLLLPNYIMELNLNYHKIHASVEE